MASDENLIREQSRTQAQSLQDQRSKVYQDWVRVRTEAVKDPLKPPSEVNSADQQFQAQLNALDAQIAQANSRAVGKNADGSPVKNEYDSLLGADGLMQKQYQVDKFQDINPDMKGMDAYRERALSNDPSAWAKLMLEKNKTAAADRRDQMVDQSASSEAQARSTLARTGGVSSGARERIATQGAHDLMFGRQKASRDAQLDDQNVYVKDEETKNQYLQNLPGLELQYIQPAMANRELDAKRQQFNIQNALSEKHNKDVYNLDTYKEQMDAWAADAQAKATASSGGGK